MSAIEAAEQSKQDGNTLFRAKDYQKACECYTQAHKLAPTDPKILTNRAMAYMEMASGSKKAATQRSLLKKAIKDCDTAIENDSSWVRGYQRKAESLLSLGQVEESISAAEQGLRVSDGTCVNCSKLVAEARLRLMKATNSSENDIWAQDRDELTESPQYHQRFRQAISVALPKPRAKPLNRKEQAEMADSERVQELVMQALDLESTALGKAVALYEQAAQRSSTIAMDALSRICLTNENPGLCALNHYEFIGLSQAAQIRFDLCTGHRSASR